MSKLKPLQLVLAVSIAMPLGIVDAAAFNSKTKPEKLTYEQAWAKCQKQVDKLQRDAQSQRYTRGAACMHTYGYRI